MSTIPEYTTPQKGITFTGGGTFYYGDHSDGFDFPKNKVSPHRHPYYEIFFFPSIRKNTRGELLADFISYSIKKPSLVFISPSQVHGWTKGHHLAGNMVAFDESFVSESSKPSQQLLRSPLFYEPHVSPVIELTPAQLKQTAVLWRNLSQEYELRDSVELIADHYTALRAHLKLVIIHAHRIAIGKECRGGEENAAKQIYQQFLKLLHQPIPVDHFPKDYARQLNVSPDHLNQTIAQATGRTVGELIRGRITLEAKRLLAHSNFTIAEIAYQLHFKDPSYFTRFYKRQTDLTPRKFRELTQYP